MSKYQCYVCGKELTGDGDTKFVFTNKDKTTVSFSPDDMIKREYCLSCFEEIDEL